MKLLKRVALSAFTRRLGLLSLLSIAPFTQADTTGSGSLFFDVPEPGESITVNLLRSDPPVLDPEWFIKSTSFKVVAVDKSETFLDTSISGQYCVTISNPIGGRAPLKSDDLEFTITPILGQPTPRPTIDTTVNGSVRAAGVDGPDPDPNPDPTNPSILLVVGDNEMPTGFERNDPSCFGLNRSPMASLEVKPTNPVNDTDFIKGEEVTLDASGSMDPDGKITDYTFIANDTVLAEGTNPIVTVPLPDGVTRVTVIVTDDSGQTGDPPPAALSASRSNSSYGEEGYGGYGGYGGSGPTGTASVDVQVNPAPTLTVDLGGNMNRVDTDAKAGEMISLTATTNVPASSEIPVTFQFFLIPPNEGNRILLESSGAQLTRLFADGMSRVRVVATVGDPEEGGGQTASNEIVINVAGPQQFVINFDNIDQADTDTKSGEVITRDFSKSTNAPPNVQVTFQFFLDPSGESNGTLLPSEGGVLSQLFKDGRSVLRVVAMAGEQSARLDIVVNVAAPTATVVANAGPDRPLTDSDGRLGEIVRLDAGQSTIPTNATTTFEWFLNPSGESNGQSLGTGQVINPRIPDGVSVVRLVATVGSQASIDEATITIGTRQADTLANLPNLTPNQRRTAVALDDVCTRLLGLESGALTGTIGQGPSGPAAALSADQLDLTEKCRGIVFNNSVDNQVEAISDITPEDFAVARTQALLFANTQYTSTLDRLIALRGGARGLSLAGLNIIVDGQNVPVAAIQDMVGKIFGSGASADATEEPGGLLSDRLGMWVRGNYSTGGRDRSLVSPSFDADQMGVILGTDYRLSRNAVIGASIAYLDSSIDFNPVGEGSLDTQSMALSVYGSIYAAKSFYLDGLVNYAMADYDARRNISYSQGSGLGDLALDANGSTEGDTVSAGLFGGYDFVVKGVTISPNLGFFYVDASIDGFTEDGAGGFNLLYDKQDFKSLTSNIGFRVNATWNLPWVVLLPGLRFDFIREFEDDVDAFQVRFAADPNGMSAPPITIQTDNPDTSYTRMSLNLSAQFKFGFAGYIEYQRIGGFDQIDFQDLAFGFRMQRSF
jgi:outer membrane autotransporter protein